MKRIQILCTLLLPILLVTHAHADPAKPLPITATLTLPYDTVLPGVPFDIRVRLKNVSNADASVGLLAALIVTLPDGTQFAPPGGTLLEPQVNPNADSTNTWAELAPGETREMAISLTSPPPWTKYDVYTSPGTYAIALQLEGTEPPPNYVGDLLTNTARLQRVMPNGEDKALWQRMLAVGGGHWSDDGFTRLKEGLALAQEIIAIHPGSQYYPYALVLRTHQELPDEMERARDAANRFTESPAHSYLLMHAAGYAFSKAARASRVNHDRATGDKYFALAQLYLDDVIKSTSNPALLNTANRVIQMIPSFRR
jgi:hypothetical protein